MSPPTSRAPSHISWLQLASIVLCGLVLLASALTVSDRLHGGDAAAFTSRNRDGSVLKQPLWRVPAFRFESQRGSQVASSELSGHVWIANFIFTTCTNVCPMMSSKLVLLQRALLDPTLRFVSFSVDPQRDTAAALDAYAKRWNGGDPRWILLRPNTQQLSALANDMRVPCKPTGEVENPVQHSGLFFLIDRSLQVRAVYDPDDPDALVQIRRDVQKLSGTQSELAADPARQGAPSVAAGERLFMQLGCDGCHHEARIAPRLDSLWGREVTLQDGTKRSADDDYLRESILRPGAHLVKGYQPLMPSYQDKISATELDSLIAYLRARSQTCTKDCGPAQPATAAVDPLCDMDIVVTPETPHAERDGTTYYFCSEGCRDAFLKSKERTQPQH